MQLARNPNLMLSLRPFGAMIAVLVSTIVLIGFAAAYSSAAHAETRTLRMYYGHSKESATITFKKNGKYIKSGLRKANRFLRDWRRKEPTNMDPALLDLVWEVYQASGSKKPIQVISGYRSPKTNRMLRRRGRAVAKTSQHTRGKALDFNLTDVPVAKLRALGLKAHGGGVGYYRGSFVHLDTGRVRHWPRMSRRQLAKVFPRGKTIHVPSDGRPMKGHRVAMANLKKGRNADGSRRTTKAGGSRLASLFRRSGNGGDENENVKKPRKVVAKAPAPKPKKVVVAKAARGADPFSQDSSAVSKAEAARLKKEAEERLAQEALEQTQTAALSRVPLPKRRPNAAAPAQPSETAVTKLALAAESALRPAQKNVLEPVGATELALATPQSLTPSAIETSLRPRAEIPSVNSQPATQDVEQANVIEQARVAEQARVIEQASVIEPQQSEQKINSNDQVVPVPNIRPETGNAGLTQPVQQVSLDQKDINGLNSRIQAALSRNRAVPAEEKPENQQLLAALAKLPIPKYATQRPTRADENSVPVPRPLEGAQIRPTVLASLQRELITQRSTAPKFGAEDKDAFVPTPARALPVPELKLGDLDGDSVKTWAVAASTRVGSAAVLQAPVYKQGTRRAAPSSVYSQGFAFARAPLRSDRFSGRSLTRVAFAHFGRTN